MCELCEHSIEKRSLWGHWLTKHSFSSFYLGVITWGVLFQNASCLRMLRKRIFACFSWAYDSLWKICKSQPFPGLQKIQLCQPLTAYWDNWLSYTPFQCHKYKFVNKNCHFHYGLLSTDGIKDVGKLWEQCRHISLLNGSSRKHIIFLSCGFSNVAVGPTAPALSRNMIWTQLFRWHDIYTGSKTQGCD